MARVTQSREDYIVTNLGRPAVFVLPMNKLPKVLADEIIAHLHKCYGGATYDKAEKRGVWVDKRGRVIADKLWEFEISFLGKNRIPALFKYLSKIARRLNEQAIYVKCGENAYIIEPRIRRERR